MSTGGVAFGGSLYMWVWMRSAFGSSLSQTEKYYGWERRLHVCNISAPFIELV